MTSNVPQLDSAPNGLTSVILRLNPHIYTPPYAHPTPAQAAAHIEAMDAAMELCTCLLRLDCTRRFTARQALTHRFLATGTEGPDAEQRVHPMLGKCGMMHYVEGGPADDMGTDEMGEGHARRECSGSESVCTG
jgi:cell division control protein 7